jgi:hypothetical protein
MTEKTAKGIICIFLASLLIASFFIALSSYANIPPKPAPPDVYVGIDAAFGSVQDVKNIIDEVKSYTNFFVVGSNNITNNLSNINEVCQYLSDNGLYFLTYAHPDNLSFSQGEWTRNAQQKWNLYYMGLYAYDEPGGHQLDHDDFFMLALEANDYADAADIYVRNLNGYLNEVRIGWQTGDFPLFASDYALHEFDYRAGYDTILTEFAWNNLRQFDIALVRGAATVHNKSWGIMITRTWNDSRFAESGQEMYDDMVLAYQNGAKYIVLFDYPNYAEGILKQEHFDALKQFWQYAKDNPRVNNLLGDRVAYVLPKDYGFGFRSADDKIWGLWEADNQSAKIWSDVNNLTVQYLNRLDIIYEDNMQGNLSAYSKFIFWNATETELP